MQIFVSIGWIVKPQELPSLNINAMAPVSMQYILKVDGFYNIFLPLVVHLDSRWRENMKGTTINTGNRGEGLIKDTW